MGRVNKHRIKRISYPSSQARIARQKEVILLWVSRGKSVAFGAAKADISYTQVKKWRGDDEKFDLALEDAYEVGTQGLEDIADSRARRRSDPLLMFLMKARDPKYRDSTKVVVETPAPIVKRRNF